MAYIPPPPTLFQRILRITLWTVVGGSVLAFFIPAILPHSRSRGPISTKTICASDLGAIGRAMQLYADDNGGAYPDTSSTQPVTPPTIER